MQSVQRLIVEIAPTEIPVLLVGESGTGKEVVALRIHSESKHKHLPFAKINCGNIDGDSLHSPLRYLGGGEKNQGAGTLFLDEICDLDANFQRQLLHSLPDGNAVVSDQPTFGRVISCTTHDPEEEVERGRLRSELFYRLNGVCLRLPPLRRRKEDIPILVRHFLDRYARLFSRAPMVLSSRATEVLVEHHWPGNIRELENVVKKIAALENEELALSDLKNRHEEVRMSSSSEIRSSLKAAARAASQKAERDLILQTLTRTHWNRRRAAEALQISYKSLLYKLKQIQVPDSDEVQ